MNELMFSASLLVVLAPLVGCLLAGLCGHWIGRAGAHSVTILGVLTALLGSAWIFWQLVQGVPSLNQTIYVWSVSGDMTFQVGFLIDKLTALMMLVVTFVSLMVHIYTIGYMQEDAGYQRFFSYISLFTFSMLMLVMANNFLQLFFGWEAVGVVSYLLIGFWFKKDSAVFANLKAFLVNRVGDLGFLLGIAVIFRYFGSLDYHVVFANMPEFARGGHSIVLFAGHSWSVITLMCILLFIGAMGKSAQVPLHVWFPDSMEGPTPISALIHAATMVTAGVFMVARMSPIFEFSDTARMVVLLIGALTACSMGLLGLVQNDIKRVIAYSTLSQLGYMVTALGASAYAVGIFHLMTHAFFKALLFLAAGSVIIGMHHEQDIRKMGNLKKYMPITYLTALIGSIALAGIPPFAGFFSKDMIIEAVSLSSLPGATFAYWAVLLSVFVTALYTFRLFFLVFHTKERMESHTKDHLHESPAVVWFPLVALAIPSMVIGYFTIGDLLFGDYFGSAIFVLPEQNALTTIAHHYQGAWALSLHAVQTIPFWLAIGGVVTAWLLYVQLPQIPAWFAKTFNGVYQILLKKYGFDEFNQWFFARGARAVGEKLWQYGDVKCIDGIMVNGSANMIGRLSLLLRTVQSGYLYHYVFAMIAGLCLLLTGLLWFY